MHLLMPGAALSTNTYALDSLKMCDAHAQEDNIGSLAEAVVSKNEDEDIEKVGLRPLLDHL